MDQYMSWSLAFCVSLKLGNKEFATTTWRHSLHFLLREMLRRVTNSDALLTANSIKDVQWRMERTKFISQSRSAPRCYKKIRQQQNEYKNLVRGRIAGCAKHNIMAERY